MFKLLVLTALVAVVCEAIGDKSPVNNQLPKGGRQKRLLFFDEEGSLVKTYKNPYLYNYAQNAIFNPLFSFMRPSYGSRTTYMIPVSEAVIQQINRDPMYQNRYLNLPRKELVVEPNQQCDGKRTQLTTKNCNSFLNCWDGWGFEQECPEGLMFSREGYCDYPQNVDCSSRSSEPATPMQPIPAAPIQQIVPIIPPAPIIPPVPIIPPAAPAQQPAASSVQCSKDFEAFRSQTQCAEFFVCVDKVPIKFQCPTGLYFNQELGVCDYANRVSCNDSIVIQAADIAVQTRPVPCVGEPSDDLLNMAPKVPKSSGSLTSVFNSQTFSSHVAISRQDAVRQLQHGDNKL